MRIAHISDLHCARSHRFNEEAMRSGIKRINEYGPDLVIVTGDLTFDGVKEEYELAMSYLDEIEAEKLIVPGNHDEKTDGDRLFERLFGERYFTREMDGILFMGLDSADPGVDTGHIGREVIQWAEKRLKTDAMKVVFMHHHVLPIPHTGRERNILTDAPDVLDMLTRNGVSLVMGGHKHVPWLWNLNGMLISHAGSFSSRRSPFENSHNIVSIEDGKIGIERVYNISGKREKISH